MAAHGYQLTASSTSASTDATTSSRQRGREQSLLLGRGQWDLWPESTVALGSSAWRWSLTSQRRSGPGEHGQTAGGIGSPSPSRCHRSPSICARPPTPPPTRLLTSLPTSKNTDAA